MDNLLYSQLSTIKDIFHKMISHIAYLYGILDQK